MDTSPDLEIDAILTLYCQNDPKEVVNRGGHSGGPARPDFFSLIVARGGENRFFL